MMKTPSTAREVNDLFFRPGFYLTFNQALFSLRFDVLWHLSRAARQIRGRCRDISFGVTEVSEKQAIKFGQMIKDIIDFQPQVTAIAYHSMTPISKAIVSAFCHLGGPFESLQLTSTEDDTQCIDGVGPILKVVSTTALKHLTLINVTLEHDLTIIFNVLQIPNPLRELVLSHGERISIKHLEQFNSALCSRHCKLTKASITPICTPSVYIVGLQSNIWIQECHPVGNMQNILQRNKKIERALNKLEDPESKAQGQEKLRELLEKEPKPLGEGREYILDLVRDA